MHFYQRITAEDLNICIDNQKIGRVYVSKFLGILIDSQLTWKAQADDICKKLSPSAYTLFNLSKKVNTNTVLIAYHGLVASILRFGVIFWGNCSEREGIFRAQKRCIRAIFNLKVTESCIPVFKKHKLLTFPCLYVLEIALFVKTNPHLFPTLHESRFRNVAMRSKYLNLLHTSGFKTTLYKKV